MMSVSRYYRVFADHPKKRAWLAENRLIYLVENDKYGNNTVSLPILVCGLGSIGYRHLRHFKALGCGPVMAYRTGKATIDSSDQVKPDATYHSLDEALEQRPTLAIISNPTSMHLPVAMKAAEAGCHLLIEKPVSHSLEGLEELEELAKRQGVMVSIAQNMRYHPTLSMIREWIRSG